MLLYTAASSFVIATFFHIGTSNSFFKAITSSNFLLAYIIIYAGYHAIISIGPSLSLIPMLLQKVYGKVAPPTKRNIKLKTST